MRRSLICIIGISSAVFRLPAYAVETVMGPAGFTGLAITPNARIQQWGTFGFTYDNQLPGVVERPKGYNLVGGFGIFPNMEIAGRIATNEINSNCYISCGARDLSGSGKFGIGIDAARHFSVAVGATDLGGKVSYFTSFYGVATYSSEVLDVSVGLAKRKDNGVAVGTGYAGSKSPLNGIFGSAVYQPVSWMQGDIEFSDGNAWAGAKLFAPPQWLPRGWKAFLGANFRLNDNQFTQRQWLSAGLTIPLYQVPALTESPKRIEPARLNSGEIRLPAYEALVPSARMVEKLEAPNSSDNLNLDAPEKNSNFTNSASDRFEISDETLLKLATQLKEKGFEDISIGRLASKAIAVNVNNATYNWNIADALGVALGTISNLLDSSQVGYSLVLSQRQLPIVAVTGQISCLTAWINNASPICTAGQLYTQGTQALDRLQDGAVWVVAGFAGSWKTTRIGLAPIINSAVATEYGLFDYSLGARVSVAQPLWTGAVAELRKIFPIASSDDYKNNGVYSDSRLQKTTDRIILTQTVRLPLERWIPNISDVNAYKYGLTGVAAQATIGRINQIYDGVHGEVRWEPGEGRHRFSLEGGSFKNSSYEPTIFGPSQSKAPEYAKPLIGSYRYAHAPTRTYFELSAGQFLYNDRGIYAGVSQWFGDVSVSLYYRRTKFEFENSPRQFVGIQFSIPIGPRKDMNPGGLLQVTGSQRVGYGVETLVRANTLNFVTLGHGVLPGVPTLNDLFNSDRAGLIYFEDNMRRIRDAARS